MNQSHYRLSVLDQCPVRSGCSVTEAVRESLELARLADAAGYHRFWLAEHHGTPPVAGVAPEVLIGPIAMATTRLRVGSGGIMLPNYMPYKVAEAFSLLSSLSPGRIDLGLGRAPGGSQLVSEALQTDNRRFHPDDFYRAFAELLELMEPSQPSNKSVALLRASLPLDQGCGPEIWVLGCSESSALWAAEHGLPYCFADFINPRTIEAAELYKQRFKPSARRDKPYLMIALWVIVAATSLEAERQAAPLRKMMSRTSAANVTRVPSLQEALDWEHSLGDTCPYPEHMVLGDPSAVRQALNAFAAKWGANELMMINMLADHQIRLEGYRMLAREFELEGDGGRGHRSLVVEPAAPAVLLAS